MFQELLKNKKFREIIDKFAKKNKAKLLDIALFGSLVRGKEKPEDIDLLLLFKDKEDLELAYSLRKGLEELGLNFSITTKTYDSLTSGNFLARESFLSEGYSLKKDRPISEEFGFRQFMLFKYELKNFSQSQRMRFQYSLYGRNKAVGMLKEFSMIKFSDQILLSPTINSEKVKEYLKSWSIKFEEMPILIPLRISP